MDDVVEQASGIPRRHRVAVENPRRHIGEKIMVRADTDDTRQAQGQAGTAGLGRHA